MVTTHSVGLFLREKNVVDPSSLSAAANALQSF